MKLRTLIAATAAAGLGIGSLLIPAAQAATVEFDGNFCRITFTAEDITEMRDAVVAADPGAVQRVKDAFPGLEDELDILIPEVRSQLLEYGGVDSTLFTAEENAALYLYLAAGKEKGYSQEELILILLAPAIPDRLGEFFEEEGDFLIGTSYLSKQQARQQIIELDNYLKSSGFDPDGDEFLGLDLSPKVSAIVAPSFNAMTVFVDQVQEPFQQCVDHKVTPGDPDPGDDGGSGGGGGGSTDPGDDGTPGGNPGGANPGGSSFGSS